MTPKKPDSIDMKDTSGYGIQFKYVSKIGTQSYDIRVGLDEETPGDYWISADFWLSSAGNDDATNLGEQYKVLSGLFWVMLDAIRHCDDKDGNLIGLWLMCAEKSGDTADKNSRLKLYQNAIDSFLSGFGITAQQDMKDRHEGWLNTRLKFNKPVAFKEILSKY